MKNFIHRTISNSIEFVDCDGNKTTVTATRTRTSAGHACIALDFGTQRMLELTNDLEDYPGTARAIAELLNEMADEPCELPKVE